MIQKRKTSGVSQAIQATMMSAAQKQELIETIAPDTFTVKIANTLEEREQVFRLAYEVYLEKGYTTENPNQWLINPYDASPDTTILIATDLSGTTVGSLTLVFDQHHPIPAEKLYAEELNNFRNTNCRLVEISRLVIRQDYRNSKEILILLFNYLFIYIHQIKKWDYLIIEVNPRHKSYYQKLLDFTEIGSLKACPQVQDAPAILLFLPASHYYEEVNKPKKTQTNTTKSRSLYPSFLTKDKETFVIRYLKRQMNEITDYEKSYFGIREPAQCLES